MLVPPLLHRHQLLESLGEGMMIVFLAADLAVAAAEVVSMMDVLSVLTLLIRHFLQHFSLDQLDTHRPLRCW